MAEQDKLLFELEQLRKELAAVHTSVKGIEERTGKIESYLYNDSNTDKDGIVKLVERHDKRLDIIEEKDKIKDAKMSVWGMVGGAVIMVAIEIIKWLFSSHK